MSEQAPDADLADELSERLHQAHDTKSALYINGGGSKRHFAGRDCQAPSLEVGEHRGVVDYQPGELVLTVRGGTSIAEIQTLLRDRGQHLSFEPPEFDGQATIGGTLASNLSGPGRPWWGSVRDMVLGVEIISGRGERLGFGGQVMKNVAGYDLSRLQAGALGTLGVISTVSLKVLPLPERTLTLSYECDAQQAVHLMHERAATPKPLTGACWLAGRLYLRLSGAASAVTHTAELWGGDSATDSGDFWSELRDLRLPFFQGDAPLWRLSLGSTAPVSGAFEGGAGLLDWGGAQRWLRGDHSLDNLHQEAAAAGGHAQLVRGGDRNAELRSPLQATQQRLQQQLKARFDPNNILNPGRLYSWL